VTASWISVMMVSARVHESNGAIISADGGITANYF
jgi:hypothetical protein